MWPDLPDGTAKDPAPQQGDLDWPRPLILICDLLAGRADTARRNAALMTAPDWQNFAELIILRHRVAPGIAEAVQVIGIEVPEDVLNAIKAEARANGFAALAQKSESLRLAKVLRGSGITPVWLKGWPLAVQLYGAPGMRHSSDIDFLIPVEDRLTVDRILRGEGYVPGEDHRLRARLISHPAVQAECKDVQYYHPETGLVVEMHWRTSPFRGWPELTDLNEGPEAVPGEDKILAPGPLGQLVYLAAHAVQHVFGRLKWLLDIARLVQRRGPDAIREDLRKAEAAGAGRAVRIALFLAHKVFAADVPPEDRALSPREARWARQILVEIADPQAAPDSPHARLGFYRWHLRIAEGPAQVTGVLRYAIWRRLRLGLAGLTRARDR